MHFGIVELDGLVYVLGGESEDCELLTVEVYDPHFNTWSVGPNMTMVRKVCLLSPFYLSFSLYK